MPEDLVRHSYYLITKLTINQFVNLKQIWVRMRENTEFWPSFICARRLFFSRRNTVVIGAAEYMSDVKKKHAAHDK